jgi:hypothetical protein
MLWRGPEIDGITQSLIQKFRQCPYRFYLYAILGLADDTPLHPNLIWGDVLHKGLEHLISSKDLNASTTAMLEYLATKYPNAPSTYEVSTKGLLQRFDLVNYEGNWQTEVTFEHPVKLPSGRIVKLRGKMDGYKTDHPDYGKVLGEHKCKGYIDPAKTRKELVTDLQVNIYCYLHGIEWINYDLILIPEAVKYKPQKAYNESPQAYMSRLIEGHCGNYQMFPVTNHKHLWIANLVPYHLPLSSQEEYWKATVEPFLQQMCDFWDYVTDSSFDPEKFNTFYYKTPARLFNGSYTENFECDYYKYLIGEQQLSDLVSIKSLFNELEEL